VPFVEGNKLAWKTIYVVGASLGKAYVAGRSIAKQSVGWAGEKRTQGPGRVKNVRAVGDGTSPRPGEIMSELGRTDPGCLVQTEKRLEQL
jgi:hypothetical protein